MLACIDVIGLVDIAVKGGQFARIANDTFL